MSNPKSLLTVSIPSVSQFIAIGLLFHVSLGFTQTPITSVDLFISKQTGEYNEFSGSDSKTTDKHEEGSVTITKQGPVVWQVTPPEFSIAPNETKTWTGSVKPDAANIPAPGTTTPASVRADYQVYYARPIELNLTGGTIVDSWQCDSCWYHGNVGGHHEKVMKNGFVFVAFQVKSTKVTTPDTIVTCIGGEVKVTATTHPESGGTMQWTVSNANLATLQNETTRTGTVKSTGNGAGWVQLIAKFTIEGVTYRDTTAVAIIEVTDLRASPGSEYQSQALGQNTRGYVACYHATDSITVTATINPAIDEDMLPGCYWLGKEQKSGVQKLTMKLPRNKPKHHNLTAKSGTSERKVKISIIQLRAKLKQKKVCDGAEAIVQLKTLPTISDRVLNTCLTNPRFNFRLNQNNMGNPLGNANLVAGNYDQQKRTFTTHGIWYSTQAAHCNEDSEHGIWITDQCACTDGTLHSDTADLTTSTKFATLKEIKTGKYTSGCMGGAAVPLGLNGFVNPGCGKGKLLEVNRGGGWRGRWQIGTFKRNVAVNLSMTCDPNSQYVAMIVREETRHAQQFNGQTNITLLAGLFDANKVVQAANQDREMQATYGSLNLLRAAAARAWARAVARENARSIRLWQRGGRGLRCALEWECKNDPQVNATHRAAYSCAYSGCRNVNIQPFFRQGTGPRP